MSQKNSFHGDLPKLQPLPVILPGQVREMNKEEKLKARLYSYAPLTAPINPRALKFKGVTQCQARKLTKPIERRVEPLPSLQKYQETHQPEFLQKKELERLEKLRKLKEEAEKALKRMKKQQRQSLTVDVDSLQDLTALKKSSSTTSEVEPSVVEKFYRQTFPIVTYEDMCLTQVEEPIVGRGKSKMGKIHTFQSTPSTDNTIKFIPSFAGLDDMDLIVKTVLENRNRIACLYLTPKVPKDSVDYHYYNLKVAEYKDVNRKDYLSMSYKFVTRIRYGMQMENMTLEQWTQEVDIFRRLRVYNTFRLHRKWKAFNVWLKNMQSLKTNLCKKFLNEHLFMLNHTLRPAIVTVVGLCLTTRQLEMYVVDDRVCYTLDSFLDTQKAQLKEVKTRLDRFRDLVANTVYHACRSCLIEAGFLPDDDPLFSANNIDFVEGSEEDEPMVYTMQANKRAICKRLTNYITMLDYMVMSTIHEVLVNSVINFDKQMRHLIELAFKPEEIAKLNPLCTDDSPPKMDITMDQESLANAMAAEENIAGRKATDTVQYSEKHSDDELPYRPMVITEIILTPESLTFYPDQQMILQSLGDLIKSWQNCAKDMENMTPDTKFDPFTSPLINNKQEEKTCGDGPNLKMVLKIDDVFQLGIISIMVSGCSREHLD
nr:dynein heavy chain 6; axonemal-like [Biomphalaria glabrata]